MSTENEQAVCTPQDSEIKTKDDSELGSKRKHAEIEKDKENNGVSQNSTTDKRAKTSANGTDSAAKGKQDDDEEEVIDTSAKKKTQTREPGKRTIKPADQADADESKQEGTYKQMVDKAVEDGEGDDDAEGDDEAEGDEKSNQECDGEHDDGKDKDEDQESEGEGVSLDEESIGELQKEDDIDLQDYLKFREKDI